MQYTIKAVNPQVRSYETKFGTMVSYKVLFEGQDTPVEIGQKQSSKAPEVGDVVEGTIDMSAPYGPKFKKEFSQGGFGGGFSGSASASTGQSSGFKPGGKFQSDPFTMYLSYAKDVAVAQIASKEGFNEEKFAEILDGVITGGKTLYGSRPGAEEDSPKENKEPSKDVIPTVEDVDNFLPPEVSALFDKEETAEPEVDWTK